MRTYQRLVIARGGSELATVNPAYPHNFLVTNSETGTLKIGSTGTRYNSLPEIGSTGQTFAPESPVIESILADETEEPIVEIPQETIWPVKKTSSRKKKKEVADESVDASDDIVG
jgi:hypothetical protein